METIRRLLRFVRPYWHLVLGAMILGLAISGVGLFQPMIMKWIIDGILTTRRFGLLAYGALAILGAAAIRGILVFLQRYMMAYSGQKIVYDIRNILYRHLQQLSFSFYDIAQTGQLMSRVTADVETLRQFLSNGLVRMSSALFSFLATLVLMLSMDYRLTFVSLIPVIPLTYLVCIYGGRVRPMFWQIQQKLAVLTATLQENITGQRVVKAFGRKAYEISKFERDNEELLRQNVNTIRLSASYESGMQLLSELSLALIIWFGGREVIAGRVSLGSLVAFNALVMQVIGPVRMLGNLVSLVQRATASGQRIFEILDTRADVTDRPGARPMPPIKGHIVFDNVSFAYEGSRQVLSDISLEVRPGETVAVLGGTGSGKSTLINLIPRFYDPTSGRILIDGIDIRDVTLESLRRQIGIVTQETFLFSASLRENIAYGKPEATMEEIIAAAKAAHIHDFIISLPDGYETPIGERGVGLSGGQKQRVAIARALLMDAKILILDESTSSVDVETEFQIQQEFNRLLRDRTAFIIAQRLSTIRNADIIIILQDGKIADRGTHEELLERSEIYRAIYDMQFRRQEKELVARESERQLTAGRR